MNEEELLAEFKKLIDNLTDPNKIMTQAVGGLLYNRYAFVSYHPTFGIRVRTHCLYPDLKAVYVYIKVDFEKQVCVVSDEGCADGVGFLNEVSEPLRERHLKTVCRKYKLEYTEGRIKSGEIASSQLLVGILTVANASSIAAYLIDQEISSEDRVL